MKLLYSDEERLDTMQKQHNVMTTNCSMDFLLYYEKEMKALKEKVNKRRAIAGSELWVDQISD